MLDLGLKSFKVRPSLYVAAIALLCLGIAGCAGGDKSASSASRAAPNILASENPSAKIATSSFMGDIDDEEENSSGSSVGDTDADIDNDVKEHSAYQDRDDALIQAYGHKANAADYRTAVGFVKRYYASAAAGDGAAVCSMMSPAFAKRVPKEFGSTAGPVYMRGDTCPVVMSRLFKHDHQKLTTVSEVTGVRVKDGQALVLLGSHTLPASYIYLIRQGGAWQSMDLLATPLP
jgi:hypothetical protein